MKIKKFVPVVFTNDASGLVAQFEALGFEKKHVKDGSDTTTAISYVMQDAEGHGFHAVQAPGFPQTFAGISLMVDDFNEAVEEFTKLGYTNIQKGSSDTGSSVATVLRSPEGLFVSVSQHNK